MEPSRYSGILSPENRSDLCPDTARKDGVGEFGGGSTHRPAAAEHDELDNSQIRQIVTIGEFGQPGRDQALRNNRDAEEPVQIGIATGQLLQGSRLRQLLRG
jgi:hypothetical protein